MSTFHVAFLPLPAIGHINVTLPVVAELVRRGHRVTYATNSRMAPLVTAVGATPMPYESPLASRKLLHQIDAEYMAHEPVRSIDEAIATVPQYEAGFGDDVPDVLLYDVSTFAAGRVLARKWKRPAIEMFATIASNEHYSLTQQIGAMYAGEIDGTHPAIIDFFVKMGVLLREHGLGDVTLEEFTAPADDANLVFLPRRFQPAHETFDDRFAFLGAGVGDRPAQQWAPPAPERPVALVSMGSFHYDNLEGLLRTCLDAFAGTRWHVVVAVGDEVDRAALGEVPENVELMRWVPQLAVLERADVFISHVGMNSVMEALYFGTPVVALPHMPEQRITAARLAELGLGVDLSGQQVTAERLRAVVDALVADDTVRGNLDALRDDLRAIDGPALAADYIEARARR